MKREQPKHPLTLHRETLLQISEDRLGREVRAAGTVRPIPPPRSVGGSAGGQCCQI